MINLIDNIEGEREVKYIEKNDKNSSCVNTKCAHFNIDHPFNCSYYISRICEFKKVKHD